MKLISTAILSLAVSMPVLAYDVQVKGYTRADGTYVQPHHRSSPDNTTYNNYNQPSTSTYNSSQQRNQNLYSMPTAPQGRSLFSMDGVQKD